MTTPTEQFRAARDFLLAYRTDYATAYAKFSWPRPATFNFAPLLREYRTSKAPDPQCLIL